ncbi:MAG TPA: ABC transporter permease [Candidatus Limnocylindrales bacterium]|nr:ABC transporter permease [Candidatus Limnocylindrales bacterium]
MNAGRVLAIARRIAEGVRRDRRSLGLVLVVPILVLALLGWVIRGQSSLSTRLGVAHGAGPAETAAASAITGLARAAGDQVVDVGADEASARAALRADQADVAIVLPADLAQAARGGQVDLLVITPGISPGDDGARLAALQTVLVDGLRQLATLPTSGGGPPPSVQLHHATVYGSPDADLLDAFAPALIGFFGFFFVFILTGISFLRERVGGTLERLLATPVRRSEIVAGYSLGFGLFAALQVVIILAFALASLSVPALGPLPPFTIGLGISNAGSPLLAFLMILLMAVGSVNLAIFLSTFARTELQVVQFIPVVIVPQALLAGIFWSIDALPGPLQPLARLMPLTYAIDGLRQVLIKGAGLEAGAVQLDLAVLVALALGLVVLAASTIRREIA